MYDDYIYKVAQEFSKRFEEISVEYNFDLGDEFEIAVCCLLEQILPERYGVCRGFIVNQIGEVAGDDIIIYDKLDYPRLRIIRNEDYSLKIKIPAEAVYAYIECKNTVLFESPEAGNSIEKAIEQVQKAKTVMATRIKYTYNMFDKYIERAGLVGGRHPQLPPYRNPPYGALFARRIAIKTANDRSLEDPIFADDFIKKNHKIRISEHIPDLQILGKNNLIGTSYSKNDKICQTLIAVNDIGPQGFYCSVFDGLAFGFGMVRMMAAIDWMRLTPLSWGTVLNDFSDRYSIAPEK